MKASVINYIAAFISVAGLFFTASCTHAPQPVPPPPAPPVVVLPPAGEPLFSSLESRLIADGINAEFVRSIYRNPAVKLEPRIIAGNIKRREKTLNYSQYLTDASVLKAKKYLSEHHVSLNNAYKKFGVPPSAVVAILTVETWLGAYTGKFPAVNVLSTMALAGDSQVQEKIFSFYSNKTITPETQKKILVSLKRREQRGYRDLKFLLAYVVKNRLDTLNVKGSVEGAIGIPQFLPSNIGSYGQDGNNDGIVDLFNHDDAIASTACFLNAHGWKKARNTGEIKKVLFCYNRSIYYVDTVFALAERLEKKRAQ